MCFDKHVRRLLAAVELPEGVEVEQMVTFLERHCEGSGDAYASKAAEALLITLDEDGKPTTTTTTKVANLRFNLGEALLEVAEMAMSAEIPPQHPLKLLVATIRFLRKMRELATIDVGTSEAEILLSISKLLYEKEAVTLDKLGECMTRAATEEQVARSLSFLERLGCVRLAENGIELVEQVTVKQQRQQ